MVESLYGAYWNRRFLTPVALVGIFLGMMSAPVSAQSDLPSYAALNQSGIGQYLKACAEYEGTERRDSCAYLHNEMSGVMENIKISRQVDARRFVTMYFNGRFERLYDCLRTTCGGLFIVKGRSGSEMASSLKSMIAFQACVHAAPATWAPGSLRSLSFVPLYRFNAAEKGEVDDCDPSTLSATELSTLKNFNFTGRY